MVFLFGTRKHDAPSCIATGVENRLSLGNGIMFLSGIEQHWIRTKHHRVPRYK